VPREHLAGVLERALRPVGDGDTDGMVTVLDTSREVQVEAPVALGDLGRPVVA
jgi:hypothetical protein